MPPPPSGLPFNAQPSKRDKHKVKQADQSWKWSPRMRKVGFEFNLDMPINPA
jgi:hypothetical protein